MTSRPSSSPSKRRNRPDSLRRSRVLKRGCRYTTVNDTHFPYLWAAYRKNVFKDELPDGLTTEDFTKVILATIGNVIQAEGEVWIFYGQSDRPVGMIVGHVAGDRMEPHVFWFPWSTPRNRLECSLKWLVDMKPRFSLFIWAKEPNWNFFFHLCKYGVIREVGKYRKFPGGGDAMLFQGVS